MSGGVSPKHTPQQAAKMLAWLMKRGLSLSELNPDALRLFILAYWPQVSALAHEIHDAEDVLQHLEAQKD